MKTSSKCGSLVRGLAITLMVVVLVVALSAQAIADEKSFFKIVDGAGALLENVAVSAWVGTEDKTVILDRLTYEFGLIKGENSVEEYSVLERCLAEADAQDPVYVKVEVSGYKTQTVTIDESVTECYTIQMTAKDEDKVSFGAITETIAYAQTITNVATSEKGRTVTYSSSNPNVATVALDTGTVTACGVGETVITASCAEDDDYLEAFAAYTLTVNQADQAALVWSDAAPSVVWNKGSYTNTLTGGTGEGAVTYTIKVQEPGDVATIDSETGGLTIAKPGTVTVVATKDGGDNYKDATSEYTLTVTKAVQTLSFETSEVTLTTGGSYSGQNATKGIVNLQSIGNITYSSSNTSVAKVKEDTGIITLCLQPGETTIKAIAEETDYFNEATASYTISVEDLDLGTSLPYTITTNGNQIEDGNWAGWYTGDVTITAAEGYALNADKLDSNGWKDSTTSFCVVDQDTGKDGEEIRFYAKDTKTGYITKVYSCVVKVDKTKPTATISVATNKGVWSKIITFFGGTTEKKNTMTIDAEDTCSGVASVQYCIVQQSTPYETESAIEQAGLEWKTYTGPVTMPEAKLTVGYAKVTDNVGNVFYASTKGFIVNSTAPALTAAVTADTEPLGKVGNYTYYGGDVKIAVEARDNPKESVGLKSVTYEVLVDQETVQTGKVFDFTVDDPAKDDLIYEFESDGTEDSPYIVVNAAKANSDNVVVRITAKDNAGNQSNVDVPLRITTNEPTVTIEYRQDPGAVTTEGETGYKYYNAARTAVISITGRKSLFPDSLDNIVNVVAQDGQGESVTGTYSIEWSRSEGENDITATATVTFKPSANYVFEVNNYVDKLNRVAYAEEEPSEKYTESFTLDDKAPNASISAKETTWDKLISKLTFGLFEREGTITITAEATDETSPVSLYYIKSNATDVISSATLNTDTNWTAWPTENLKVESDECLTVYLKAIDKSGNSTIVSTEGIIYDSTESGITITPVAEPNTNGYYNTDVTLKVSVLDKDEDGTHSGIKTIEYKIYHGDNGDDVQWSTLYKFDNTSPEYEDLCTAWSSDTQRENKNIVVSAKDNNYDDVKVAVRVTDNAGNVKIETKELKINHAAPTVSLSYDNNNCVKETRTNNYYDAVRTATIVITDRTSTFDEAAATNAISITAKDAKGEDVDGTYEISKWTTVEGTTPDAATHTATITFSGDANYTLAIANYKNKADRESKDVAVSEDTKHPYLFTVDMTAPVDLKVSVSTKDAEEKSWEKLIEKLTFGLYTKNKASVTASASDSTSPFELVYYKSTDSTAMSAAALDELDEEWIPFREFDVDTDEHFVVYVKATDYAGNYAYFSSDGYVVDKNTPSIVLTPEKANANDYYNKDVTVGIQIKDADVNASHSGIKTISYKVYNDKNVTQGEEETLYSFSTENPEYADLLSSWSGSIVVDAEKNNSDKVKVEVTVTDNAGNTVTEEVSLKINCTEPMVSLSYDQEADEKTFVKEVSGRGYYNDTRTATIVITDRTSTFDEDAATNAISVAAKDASGKSVEGTYKITKWATVEGSTPDAATHTATITFNGDANYTLELANYKNKADVLNEMVTVPENTKTPYVFTVDMTVPEADVTVKGPNGGIDKTNKWTKLLDVLTWRVWHNNTVTVSISSEDVTSPLEKNAYYKTYNSVKSAEDLAALSEDAWTEYDAPIEITASEQFILYVRATDYAGNTKYISTDGVIVDDVQTAVSVTPPQTTTGFYTGDVQVDISVEEPSRGKYQGAETYSGVGKVVCQVYNMGVETQNATLFTYEDGDLPTEWNGTYTVDAAKNNSNDVKVLVTVFDNAGNETYVGETSIKIDVTAPTISVSYDNNSGDSTLDGNTYFNENRTATITVTERNFDEDAVNIEIANTDGVVPSISGWSSIAGTGNGDDAKHVTTVTYSADGDYTFGISCKDMAGLNSSSVAYGSSVAPTSFTIDKTLPVITVEYDNNEALNNNYYKEARIATVTIKEHNFETSRVETTITAVDDGKAVTAPSLSNWTTSGDTNTATIEYTTDAEYTFDISYTDKAGNSATDYAKDDFYVDITAPVVRLEGIMDESANNDKGNIGLVLSATDTNFDIFEAKLTATVYENDKFQVKVIDIGKVTEIDHGQVYTVENLADDGIYTLKATITDKAGNEYTEVLMENTKGEEYPKEVLAQDSIATFSVNRQGSVFCLDDNTLGLVNQFYVQNVQEDVVVLEINADALQSYGVTINGQEIEEGKNGFTVTVDQSDWYHYTYTISKDLFAEEGEYEVVVYSTDKANNNAFSDVKSAKVNFVVDRTAPVLAVTGMQTGGRYRVSEQLVSLVPTDDGGALASILVRTIDKDGNPIEELLSLEGEELERALEEGNGVLTFVIGEGLYQNIEIICKDYAVDGEGNVNVTDEIYNNISVSTSGFMIFWANKPLRYSVLSALVLFVAAGAYILLKKKNPKKSKSKA